MWYRWMAIAFLTNGLSQFGVRVMQEMGLAKSHGDLYLAFWYLTGLIVAVIVVLSVRKSKRITGTELLVGGIMGLASCSCWFMITLSLSYGVPGYLVFPVAVGGSLSVVALFGVFFFRERLSLYGYAGIVAGISAMVLLVLA